jgi:hypothetical protein
VILHLSNGERISVRADQAAGVINALVAQMPVIEIDRYADGRWWDLTIPLTGIAYIQQARPKQ